MRCTSTLALVFAAAGLVAADTYPRQLAVDAIHYRFSVTLSDTSPHIEAEATATFRLLAATDRIELDLIGETMQGGAEAPPSGSGATQIGGAKAPPSGSGAAQIGGAKAPPSARTAPRTGMTVKQVVSRGEAVSFSHLENRLRLAVPSTARVGDDVTYTITYSGTPTNGLQVFTNMHGERVVFSEGWPNRARHWLPVIDHPYDKATGEMIVIAPSKWQVVSNGVLVEEVDVDGERRRTHWKQSVPLATWLYAIGVARFDAHHASTAEGIPLQTWAFPQDRAAARALFEETTRRAVHFFSDRVGPYPYAKLANVQASGFAGGMENATVIFYGEKGVASGRGPVVHEVAHQWFGNSVTERDWDDVWLSEGFATYFALLYREHFDGRDAFVEALRQSRATVLETSRKLPDTPVIHRNLADMQQVLNSLVYEKGGWVLHMLRGEVGTAAFWRGIREYYSRYRDRNASTDDFRQVMEQMSGKDLRRFFAQWLTRGGNPSIEASWHYDATRKAVAVTLRQLQRGDPYVLNVDVGVTTTNGRQVHKVRLDQASAIVTLPSEVVPVDVAIDPETWLLADVSVRR